jgi:serine/threonine protein kinase
MQYLESRRFMLHRDLAARNFLVTEEFCVKLADFGRARYVFDDSYQAPRNEKICIKWSPPEVLLDSVYSTKSDVWAMGVVFWEVLSHGERPYSSLSGEQTAVYVVEGGRLDKPPGCPPDLFAIMRSCWRRKAEDRPSFAHLSDKLRSKSSIYYVRPPRTSNNKLMNVRNSNPVRDENKVVSPSRHKVKAPNSVGNKSATSRNMRKSATASGDCLRLDLDLVDEMDRRIPVTSSSETSLTSIPGPGGTADDIGRGDRIRKSLRKLMNIKTNGKHRKVLRASDLNDIRSAGFGYT